MKQDIMKKYLPVSLFMGIILSLVAVIWNSAWENNERVWADTQSKIEKKADNKLIMIYIEKMDERIEKDRKEQQKVNEQLYETMQKLIMQQIKANDDNNKGE